MLELGYQPNAAARTLATGKTGVIGMLVQYLDDSFFNDIVQAVNKHLMESGYYLAISIMNDVINNGNGINFIFQEQRVDGILVLTPINEEDYILEMKKKNVPFVLIDNQKSNSSVSSILIDNYKGGYEAANHLIQLGHKKIGYIGGDVVYLSSTEREKGFRDALKDSEIEPYKTENGNFGAQSGYDITKKWLEQGIIPTGIFVADDYGAFGAIDAIREFGLKVPEDISVCGFDDDPLSSLLHPKLTTVKQPGEEIGKKAVEVLLDLINGSGRRNSTIKIQPELIIRQSTSIPKN
jgi:DNA-binding LacI/PurR family transcriptional regulator